MEYAASSLKGYLKERAQARFNARANRWLAIVFYTSLGAYFLAHIIAYFAYFS